MGGDPGIARLAGHTFAVAGGDSGPVDESSGGLAVMASPPESARCAAVPCGRGERQAAVVEDPGAGLGVGGGRWCSSRKSLTNGLRWSSRSSTASSGCSGCSGGLREAAVPHHVCVHTGDVRVDQSGQQVRFADPQQPAPSTEVSAAAFNLLRRRLEHHRPLDRTLLPPSRPAPCLLNGNDEMKCAGISSGPMAVVCWCPRASSAVWRPGPTSVSRSRCRGGLGRQR